MFINYPVSPLSPADFPEIMEVWEQSVRATHHFLDENDIVAYKTLIGTGYLKTIRLFGIRGKDGRLLGFTAITNVQIRLLFIRPEARAAGIGRALVNYVVQHYQISTVDVNEQNVRALGFYTRLGFDITGRSAEDALGKPFPVLSMRLSGNRPHALIFKLLDE